METSATQIRHYLKSLEDLPGSRLQDVIDEEVFEVLAGLAWVRQALADFAHPPAPEKRAGRLGDLQTLAT